MNRVGRFAAVIACAVMARVAIAEAAPMHGRGETVTQIFAHALPNVPGKSLIAIEVSYAPGGRSLPHRHARSAFIYGYVVSGTFRSQIAGEPVHVYGPGQSFFEAPGSHHVLGENASETVPAKLLAIFIVDTDDKILTVPDK